MEFALIIMCLKPMYLISNFNLPDTLKIFTCAFLLSVGYVLNSTLAPALGLPLNPEAAAEAEKVLSSSLRKIESVWLKGKGRFLLGGFQPSIADLSLVCEIMQLEVTFYILLISF